MHPTEPLAKGFNALDICGKQIDCGNLNASEEHFITTTTDRTAAAAIGAEQPARSEEEVGYVIPIQLNSRCCATLRVTAAPPAARWPSASAGGMD